MNEFLLSFPLALLSEAGVLCAHSLPNERMMNTFDADIFTRDLTGDDYVAPLGSAYLLTWGRKYTPEQTAELAERWNVKLFCLGHEHAETGIELRNPNTLILNSDHERATVLPLDLADLPTAEEALMLGVPLSSIG